MIQSLSSDICVVETRLLIKVYLLVVCQQAAHLISFFSLGRFRIATKCTREQENFPHVF